MNKNQARFTFRKKKKDIKYSETPPPGRLNYSNVQEVKPTPALAGCKGQKLLHHAQVKVCIHYSVKPEKNQTSPLVFVQGKRKTPALEFLVFVHSPLLAPRLPLLLLPPHSYIHLLMEHFQNSTLRIKKVCRRETINFLRLQSRSSGNHPRLVSLI